VGRVKYTDAYCRTCLNWYRWRKSETQLLRDANCPDCGHGLISIGRGRMRAVTVHRCGGERSEGTPVFKKA